MEIREVGWQEYDVAVGAQVLTRFGSVEFNRLNAARAEEVRCLVGVDENGRARAGIIAGRRGLQWRCPFSAPWGEVSCAADISLRRLGEFFDALKTYFRGQPLSITLAPEIFGGSLLSKVAGTALNRAVNATFDFSYEYNLSKVDDFERRLWPKAATKFRHALHEGFGFEQCTLDRAYDVIHANRDAHNYRLAMSLDQMVETASVIDIESFVLTLGDVDVASAIVYRMTPTIAHLVYWGDRPGYSSKRPMNLLPYRLFEHYRRRGFATVNVGPASTDGVPNEGLCEFKESLGCRVSLLPTIEL